MSQNSIFLKIKSGEIPGKIIFEDDQCFAIEDINPQAPVHVLIIPNKEIAKVSDSEESDKADKYNLNDNYRLVINNGADAGQSVFHIHVHLLGGRGLTWPPG